jgi:monoamine oxidase
VYTGAGAGKAFTAMSAEERIRTAIAQVEQICPGSAAHGAAARTIPGNEPFTQGLAAFRRQVTAFWEPCAGTGPLVFARSIAMHQGYMEGAVERRAGGASLLGHAWQIRLTRCFQYNRLYNQSRREIALSLWSHSL